MRKSSSMPAMSPFTATQVFLSLSTERFSSAMSFSFSGLIFTQTMQPSLKALCMRSVSANSVRDSILICSFPSF